MSELPAGVRPAELPEPRNSASAILVRRGESGWEVLLGIRSRRARFMPGHLAFPGGGVDPVDGSGEDAWERCVSRELAEEAGLQVAAGGWLPAGERITPPVFPLRFRTRFFLAPLPRMAQDRLEPASPENETLRVEPARSILDAWQRGACRVAPPVLALLRTLAEASDVEPAALAAELARANALEQRAPRIEFVPGVWMLPVRTATLPPATHTNVWMPGGRRFVVIDPGSAELQENEQLLEVIGRRRASGDEPVAVLLTHHHQDHASGAKAVADALGLQLRAHPATLERLSDLPRGGVAPLSDGERLELGATSLRAVFTPGHAPGHLVFHIEERGLLIAGDLVSGLSTILVDPREGDMGAYLESLVRARDLGCTMLLPGHGPPLPGKALDRVIAHRAERAEALLALLGPQAVPLAAIAGEIYSDGPEMPAALTEAQTLSQLLHLEGQGRVRRVDSGGRSWSRTEESG